jgi:glycosyltransferase involved in cell wall biosynthesis
MSTAPILDATTLPRLDRGGHDVVMLLENEPYPQDTRVRREAETLVRAGHRVRVLAPLVAEQGQREEVAGVTVTRFACPQSPGGLRGYLWEYGVAHAQLFSRALRAAAGAATVIHAHNPPDSLALAGLIARPLGVRTVYDCHDLAPELFEEKFSNALGASAMRATQRAAVRVADAVLVTNESQRELLAPLTSSPDKIRVVRNGPPRSILRAATSGRPGVLHDPQLVFVGALNEQDGVVALADVLARVRAHEQCANATLLVVGDGRCRAALESRVRELGLENACRFTGRVPHERVAMLLAEADIGTDPAPCTPFNERSTMIKVVEYLAAGRAVVAFDLLETRRTAAGAAVLTQCGDLDAFARAVVSLAVDPRLRAAHETQARERAEALVWEHSERTLLDVYERL